MFDSTSANIPGARSVPLRSSAIRASGWLTRTQNQRLAPLGAEPARATFSTRSGAVLDALRGRQNQHRRLRAYLQLNPELDALDPNRIGLRDELRRER